MSTNPHVIVVAGPTASGKSDFAVDLALSCNGEIISADSRQVYKSLALGTGKITEEEMKSVPHYMLSVYELGEEVSVARYRRDALPILEDILARGKTPIICGGTGQYIDALIYTNEDPGVPPNHALRKSLEEKTAEELYEELKECDPRRAAAIDKHNHVRLVRALEIVHSLGSVPPLEAPTLRFPITMYLMSPTREVLRARVVRRIEKRLEAGMLDEVRSIHAKGYDKAMLKRFGIEYDVIGEYLDGKISYEDMKLILSQKIMQYVKRQETWNKKYTSFAKKIVVKE